MLIYEPFVNSTISLCEYFDAVYIECKVKVSATESNLEELQSQYVHFDQCTLSQTITCSFRLYESAAPNTIRLTRSGQQKIIEVIQLTFEYALHSF